MGGRHCRKRLAFICTEKSGKLQRTTGDSEHVPPWQEYSLCSYFRLTSCISSKGVSCFFYLCTGFTRAFGRITARLAPSIVIQSMKSGNSKIVMKSSTAKICLGFVLLAIGCGIYLLFRSKTLYIYVWCKSLGLSGYIDMLRLAVLHWSLPNFVKYSLPDGLYCASYLFIMDAIWHKDGTWQKYLIISVVPILTIIAVR